MLDPISPELVLVDPELARDDRTWLRVPAWRQVAAHTTTVNRIPRRPSATTRFRPAKQWAWRDLVESPGKHLALALLALSLLANGILAAIVLTEITTPTTTVALVTPPPVSSAPSSRETSHASPGTRERSRPRGSSKQANATAQRRKQTTQRAVAVHETRTSVERKILRLLIQAPRSKLPRALIDETTGLAKNNIQAVCRQRKRTLFICVVRPSRHKPREGLSVRYRIDRTGRGILTWGRYRNG